MQEASATSASATTELGSVVDSGAWGSLAPALGVQPHSMLAAVASTCDLYAFCPDKRVRVFNAKAAGPLRCSRMLLPQLLDESFVRRFPDFWRESASEQAARAGETVLACGFGARHVPSQQEAVMEAAVG